LLSNVTALSSLPQTDCEAAIFSFLDFRHLNALYSSHPNESHLAIQINRRKNEEA